MPKTNWLLSIIFFAGSVHANLLYDLEKKKLDIENMRSQLVFEISDTEKKVLINQQAIVEKKSELAQFFKTDRQLKSFGFGGILAVQSERQFQTNIRIFEKIKSKNINSLRELKFYSEDLSYQKKLLSEKQQSLQKTNAELAKQIENLAEAEIRVLQNMLLTNEKSLLKSKGQLLPPTRAVPIVLTENKAVSNQFAYITKGLMYKTKLGADIQAVGPGKIIFRDHIKYWGESIIIEHEGDYYSVYTNLKNCSFQKNQEIHQGEKIGEAAKNEFYFELRNKNIVLNALKWIRN